MTVESIATPPASPQDQHTNAYGGTGQPASLFSPLRMRSVALRNRIVVSPMCEYSCEALDGRATDWHFVHLGSRAVGGAALVFTEAAAVEARGRISLQDLGIWEDAQISPLARITRFIAEHGAVPGIQLAHAGRKASVARPWEGGAQLDLAQGGWMTVGPSAVAFAEHDRAPHALALSDLDAVTDAFVQSTRRALAAGFRVIELHAAHGYLLHQFLSPVSNQRIDAYGGAFENRIRYPLAVVRAVRAAWPDELPLIVRVSATDWLEGEPDRLGWDVDQTVAFARAVREVGADMVDCSSGGNVPHVRIPTGPGYQVPFAARVRREAGIATMAVGLITGPEQADQIVRAGEADLIALARAELRDPYWPLTAARALGADGPWPAQYVRARL